MLRRALLLLFATALVIAAHAGFVNAEDRVFAADARPQLVLEKGAGEGPAWDPKLGLLFSGDGNIMRLDQAGKRSVYRSGAGTNGLVVTPDDRYLYVADNNNNDLGGARKLWRFNLQKDGDVDHSSRKLIYDWGSSRGPDGMVLDREGRLYVAGGLNTSRAPVETNDKKGGVYVFSPEGKLLEFVHIPRDEVTNCTFGGDDLKTLYITAGGTLWSVQAITAGELAWPR